MTETDSEMLEKLKCNARIGADMSPGDPVAAWAATKIDSITSDLSMFLGFVDEVVPPGSPLAKKAQYMRTHHLPASG